jgi:hypothetical protein
MSATTQLTTFSDLYTDLQNRVRVQTGQTATENQAKRYINIALHDMHVGFAEGMTWAERDAVLRTQPEYTTGTVAATQGSTTLTGTGTAWNSNNAWAVTNVSAGGRLVINGSEEVYEVSSVESDTSLTMVKRFVDSTGTGLSYTYFEDEYDLAADFLRPIDMQSFSDAAGIDLIGRTEFRRRYPRNKVTNKPRVATIQDRAPSGSTTVRRRVRFWQPPNAAYLIPYHYVTANLAVSSAGVTAANLSADTDEPIVPLRYRHAILFHALYHWYRDKRDDARSAEAKGEYTDIMIRVISDTEIGQRRPQFRPRISHYWDRARRPYRGNSSGYHVTGTAFDEIR